MLYKNNIIDKSKGRKKIIRTLMIRRIVTICLCFTPYMSFAQMDQKSELYKTIMLKDSQLFEVDFNTCDISQFVNLLSTEVDFFHDKDRTSDKSEVLYNFRNGLCKSPDSHQSRRQLIASSTAIFTLYKEDKIYAVIQNGEHRFYETVLGT
jgi:hypothetical protein